MTRKTPLTFLRPWLAVCALVLMPACVVVDLPPDELVPASTAAESSAPLGGEALAQRKLEMERAYRDMVHFHTTLVSLNRRDDRSGQVMMKDFLDRYLDLHVEPMLRPEWQSRHPELTTLDANLRFAEAETLMQLGATRRAGRIVDDIERRYEGRDDMLVGYPFGRKSTLVEALELLR